MLFDDFQIQIVPLNIHGGVADPADFNAVLAKEKTRAVKKTFGVSSHKQKAGKLVFLLLEKMDSVLKGIEGDDISNFVWKNSKGSKTKSKGMKKK